MKRDILYLTESNWGQDIFSCRIHYAFGGCVLLCGQHIILSDSYLSKGSLSASHPNTLSGVFIITAGAASICLLGVSTSQPGHHKADTHRWMDTHVYMCTHFSTLRRTKLLSLSRVNVVVDLWPEHIPL